MMSLIIPAPWRVAATNGHFTLRAGDTVEWGTESLAALAEEFVYELAAANRPQLAVGGSGSIRLEINDQFDAVSLPPGANGISPRDARPLTELYRLTVAPNGIMIQGASREAVYRGLTSLRHLVEHSDGDGDTVDLPTLEIFDAPRYAWRGLSLDVARTFFTVEEVKRVIDQLAQYKLNVLHLHLTDAQGWRLQIDSWPNLTRIGGAGATGDRPGGFYTHSQFSELVHYAEQRFVTIVPEIDLPGHCTAVFASYPELCPSQPDPNPDLPIGSLDPDHPGTMTFLRDVLAEVAELSPGPYIHIGADEPFGMDDDKYVRFVAQQCQIVGDLGKKAVGWQEAARAGAGAPAVVQYWMHTPEGMPTPGEFADHGIDLPPDVLAEIAASLARAGEDLPAALAAGARIIVSPLAFVYLDRPYSEPGAPEQEEARARLGLALYPGTTVQEAIQWDPLTIRPELTSEDDVAGIEAAVWCETLASFDDLQFMLQPRLAGVAERAWVQPGPIDWTDYAKRLARQSRWWRRERWNFFRASSVDWS